MRKGVEELLNYASLGMVVLIGLLMFSSPWGILLILALGTTKHSKGKRWSFFPSVDCEIVDENNE